MMKVLSNENIVTKSYKVDHHNYNRGFAEKKLLKNKACCAASDTCNSLGKEMISYMKLLVGRE